MFELLIGQRLLFKVETKVGQSIHFGGSYVVRRVCADQGDIIKMLELKGGETTPTKVIFTPPFSNLGSQTIDVEESISL